MRRSNIQRNKYEKIEEELTQCNPRRKAYRKFQTFQIIPKWAKPELSRTESWITKCQNWKIDQNNPERNLHQKWMYKQRRYSRNNTINKHLLEHEPTIPNNPTPSLVQKFCMVEPLKKIEHIFVAPNFPEGIGKRQRAPVDSLTVKQRMFFIT